MPETTTPAPPPTVSGDALRIVLFGMPAAGKSSLLGALGEAAQTQEHVLHGRLADLSQGLAELRQRLYDESPRRTVEEIVPYPITFESFGEDRDGAGAAPRHCSSTVTAGSPTTCWCGARRSTTPVPRGH